MFSTRRTSKVLVLKEGDPISGLKMRETSNNFNMRVTVALSLALAVWVPLLKIGRLALSERAEDINSIQAINRFEAINELTHPCYSSNNRFGAKWILTDLSEHPLNFKLHEKEKKTRTLLLLRIKNTWIVRQRWTLRLSLYFALRCKRDYEFAMGSNLRDFLLQKQFG